VRDLTRTLAVVSLLIPVSAYPLGIGEIKLHSALNQNLDAEISLILSPGEKLADVKVKLASPDKFDENGVPWTYYLSKIKFEAVSTGGAAIIRISSNEALKEPFLNFLMEVGWPKGNLYREFTLLVDPPELQDQASAPITTSRTRNYAPEPVDEQDYVPRERSTANIEAEAFDEAPETGGYGYGPTARNETLWKIAERLSGEAGVSPTQMMMALYKANPHAFYKTNVNALLAGKTLRVPSKEVILRMSRSQAESAFQHHIQAWRNHQAQPVSAKDRSAEPALNQLTLIAPTQESVSQNTIIAPGGERQAGGTVASVSTQNTTSGSTSGDSELQVRVETLENQMAVLLQQLAVKNQQLATLQNQMPTKPVAPTTSETTPIKPEDITPPKTIPVVPLRPNPKSDSSLPNDEEETSKPNSATLTNKPEPTSEGRQSTPKPSAQPKPPVQRPVIKQPVQSAETGASKDSGITGWLFGLGGVGALLGLGWLLWQRKQNKGNDLLTANERWRSLSRQRSEQKQGKDSDFAEGQGPSGGAYGDLSEDDFTADLEIDETMFSNDFVVDDFDVVELDQGEIDPVSEADVYLAYGRYQQAEDLMRDAIAEHPERDECKLKLLEVFYANGNKEGFEKYVDELIEIGKKEDIGFWAKVAEMASEISPDSTLFTTPFSPGVHHPVDLGKSSFEDTGLITAKPEDAAPNVLDESDDLDFDLASFEELFGSSSPEDILGNKAAMFDLDSLSFDNEIADASDNASKINPETEVLADFDIDSPDADSSSPEIEEFDLDLFESDTTFAKIQKKPESDIERIEFDTDLSSVGEVEADLPRSDIETIDFDMDAFKIDISKREDAEAPRTDIETIEFAPEPKTETVTRAESTKPELETIDFDLDLFDVAKPEVAQEEPETIILDPDLFSDEGARANEADQLEYVAEDGLEFDLDMFASEPSVLKAIDASAATSPSNDGSEDDFSAGFQLDFSPDEVESEEVRDFNLSIADDYDSDFSEAMLAGFSEKAEPVLQPRDELDDFDFSLPDGLDDEQGHNFGIGNLADMDEMETKLDLAIAYIDMGDQEAAKEIATEVLAKGSVEQQNVAKALLDSLG